MTTGSVVSFVEARLDEDEQMIRAAEDPDGPQTVRAVAEASAKRRILGEYCVANEAAREPGEISGRVARFAFWLALTALAEIWANHPDFDPLWRAGAEGAR